MRELPDRYPLIEKIGKWLLLVAVFLMGGLGGWWLRGNHPDTSSSAAQTTATSSKLRKASDPLTQANTNGEVVTSQVSITSEDESFDDQEALVVVKLDSVRDLLNADVPSLEDRTQLIGDNDVLAEFLNLSETEIRKLNSFWSELHPKVETIRKDKARFSELDDGGLWVGIEGFPAEGEQLRKEFQQTIVDQLGAERADVFLDTLKAGDSFGQWGRVADSGFSVYVVEESDGTLLYEILEQAPDGKQQPKKWLVPRMPSHLQELANNVGLPLEPSTE